MPDVTSGQATAADPVAMISALIDAERVVPEPKPEVKAEEPAQPEEEAYEPQQNAVEEGADAKPETAEIPLDQLEAIELETTYKAEDGKDITEKLPIKELRSGYMRQKAYQRKTAEVARQREEVGQKVSQGIESERLRYASELQALEKTLFDTVAPELKNVNWNDLAENNTFEYVRLSNRQNQINQALAVIKTKQQEVNSKIDADRRQATQAAAQKTWATLEAEIPGWNPETYQQVLKSAESVGYTSGEAGAWLDPRAIKLLHKAHLYDQQQSGKSVADKKVVSAPPVIKAGSAPAVNKQSQQKNRALENLRKGGKVEDMAAFLSAIK